MLHILDDCDLLPQEYLIDSPPNEFNLSDDSEDDKIEKHMINFIENMSETSTKLCSIRSNSDKYLIDVCANTILHILEIKCSDPKVEINQVFFVLTFIFTFYFSPII